MLKKKSALFSIFVALLMVLPTITFGQKKASQSRYKPRTETTTKSAAGFTGALEYYKLLRNNPATGKFSYEDYYNARKDVANFTSNQRSNISWQSIGPTDQGGRVRSIIIDKNDPQIMYAGAVSGGLWKTTNLGQSWFPIDDMMQSLIVSCVAQAPNGIIYFGTGEGFAPSFGSTAGSTGFAGMGIFKSTDATGTTFNQITSTTPGSSNGWEYVYNIQIHPNGDIYAATKRGIKKSTDGGETWDNPLSSFPGTTAEAHDVDISANGNVISLVCGRRVYISTDAGATYENVSTGGSMLPSSGLSRIEIGIAPSNPNIIYASAAKSGSESLHNIYRSADAGQTWEIIGPGGSDNFNPLGTQGYFDNAIVVHPTNPNKIFVGGLDMWKWELGGNWEQVSLWYLSETSPFYLHADHHKYIFHPDNPNIMFFGTDGGVAKSTNGGQTFETINRNFTTLQNYKISISREGRIMCGTQDNGTLLMPRDGFVAGRSYPVAGGDGGYSSFSLLNDGLLFASVYFGDVRRTPIGTAETMTQFYDEYVEGITGFGTPSFASFVTPLVLHEKIDDYLSPDSILYTHVGETKYGGDEITVISGTSNYPFQYTLPLDIDSIVEDDKLLIQDIVTSKFYVGINGQVIMTRDAHDFSTQPEWWPISQFSGMVQTMAVSKCGNYLFVGTSNGNLYRISNLNFANDLTSASTHDVSQSKPYPVNPFCVVETKKLNISTSGRPINGISVDPNDPSRIVVALGSYGSTSYVYYSSNALDEDPTFANKQALLPAMPLYSALIDMNNPNTVILGTEFGIYMTTDITSSNPNWAEANDGGIARVPVYDLRQQIYQYPGVTNLGVVYAGTHGRGVFESFDFVSIPENEVAEQNPVKLLQIYPNPANETISLNVKTNNDGYSIRILNISGKTIHQEFNNNVLNNTISVNISNLKSGVYFIEVYDSTSKQTGKFIKID